MNERGGQIDRTTLLKNAVVEVKSMRAKLEALERARAEPIAVIGMSCRFPGGSDPAEYWQMLRDGRDAVTEIPPDRWDVDAWFDGDREAPGKMYMRRAGFIDHIYDFDALFFDISPREAVKMDPQHRLLLEVTWEAIESAGQAPDGLVDSKTGVFIGITGSDYAMRLTGSGAELDAYATTGNPHSMASGRISYTLGLRGPSLSVDTACSSSLVAIHLAVQSLRTGECDLALAGGVNVILVPEPNVGLCKMGALAVDGRCKSFDAAADGYGRGEGCGVVVLKRLSDALAHGDPILAVIRGSAVNQDGPSSGLTVPNGLAQCELIRGALHNAGVQPTELTFVEAHGTGTPLGDPIEAQALGDALSVGRSKDHPLYIGTVKANIGHLEGAAGVAGLIKVVQCLRHEELPPHPRLNAVNPRISLDAMTAVIPTQRIRWQGIDGRRIAGVSSFGFSGTNAHLILDAAPPVPAPVEDSASPDRGSHLLVLSAKSPGALKELAGRFEQHLRGHPDESFADVCFTAGAGRAHPAHRLAVVAGAAAEAADKLGAFVADRDDGVRIGKIQGKTAPKVVFLFTGQGAQYAGMGRALFVTQPAFRRALERCDALLRPHLERSLLSVLYPEPGTETPIDETAYTQPCLFALEFALAELWRSWGIKPAAVIGHSVGEYVAAVVAGIFSLEDGLALIAARGKLMQALPAGGAMAAVFADEARVSAAIAPYAGKLGIAAENGPAETVISGDSAAVAVVVETLARAGVKSKPLRVSHAFHSPLMAPMLDGFAEKLREIAFSPPRLAFVSNVTGTVMKDREPARPDYWLRHVSAPVRFFRGVQALRALKHDLFLELGPSPALCSMGKRCLPDEAAQWLPSLRRGIADRAQMLESLGALHLRGIGIDWAGLDNDRPRRRLALPTYPWQRRTYVHSIGDPRPGHAREGRGDGPASDEPNRPYRLLGRRLDSPVLHDTVFECRFGVDKMPFLRDTGLLAHVGVYKELLASAAREVFGTAACISEDVSFVQGLIVPEEHDARVQLALESVDEGALSFQIFSTDESSVGCANPWTRNVTGTLRRYTESAPPVPVDRGAILRNCPEPMSGDAFYEAMAERGLKMGATTRVIEEIHRGKRQALGRMRAGRAEEYSAGYALKVHPGVVDALFQLVHVVLPEDVHATTPYMLIGYERFRFYGSSGSELWCHAALRPTDDSLELSLDLIVFDETGRRVAEVAGARCRGLSRAVLLSLARWPTQPGADGGVSLAELAAAAPDSRPALIEAYLLRTLARILQAEVSELEPDRLFAGLLDSLMMVELSTRIKFDLGVAITPADLFHQDLSASSVAAQILTALAARTAAREHRGDSPGQRGFPGG
jgi:acyl transferase domain-containing protein